MVLHHGPDRRSGLSQLCPADGSNWMKIDCAAALKQLTSGGIDFPA